LRAIPSKTRGTNQKRDSKAGCAKYTSLPPDGNQGETENFKGLSGTQQRHFYNLSLASAIGESFRKGTGVTMRVQDEDGDQGTVAGLAAAGRKRGRRRQGECIIGTPATKTTDEETLIKV